MMFPKEPGVYLMKDGDGQVLYVGKAKNLRQRIKQYFVPGGDGRFMVPYLIAKVVEIKTMVVFSEKEALLLENNLIKKHQPRYNALLKDDKTYVALKVTSQHEWPMLQLVRYRGKPPPDGLYFGPYTSAYGARQTLDLLQKIFPLRQCSDQELARRTRPCILYGMKRCIAPCVQKCTKEEYTSLVTRLIQFLRGQNQEVLQDLYTEMQQASDRLDFEKAAIILKTIKYIEKTVEGQLVDKPLGGDSDVIALFREGEEVVVAQLIFRGGKLEAAHHFTFSHIAEEDDELFSTFVMQHYSGQSELPHEILLPVQLEDAASLTEVIAAQSKRKVAILTPARGSKRSLVEMAQANAEAFYKQSKDQTEIREKILLEMQETFNLSRYPKVIECIDSSNLGSSEPVASLVVFVDGEKEKKLYRTYKIRTVEAPNDYAALEEVLTRRYKRAEMENTLPDLLVVDGGKGHLGIAQKVFAALNVVTVNLIAMAKEEGRHDKGMTAEQVFLPNEKEPIRLKNTSPILFMLQKIRDEAHRVAITFQRKRRSKRSLSSGMENIPGIGPIKRKALLRYFGSMKKMQEATREELQMAPKMSKANVEALWRYLHP